MKPSTLGKNETDNLIKQGNIQTKVSKIQSKLIYSYWKCSLYVTSIKLKQKLIEFNHMQLLHPDIESRNTVSITQAQCHR